MSKKYHRFHDPLCPEDTETQTVGCRHTAPSTCLRNSLAGVCAFAREDNTCVEPPISWARQYRKLKVLQDVTKG
ncbi:MAG: hypothetical protein ACHREM_09815 [Polyangiales bacterium]